MNAPTILMFIAILVVGIWIGRRQKKSDSEYLLPPKKAAATRETSGEDSEKLYGLERLFIIGFLGAWLCGWTVGIFVAAQVLLLSIFSDADGSIATRLFMVFWLCGAIFGWFAAAHVWIQAVRGRRSKFMKKRQ